MISGGVLDAFLWVMGTFTVQEFLQFYMRDVVQVFTFLGSRWRASGGRVSIFGAALLLGAVAPSLWPDPFGPLWAQDHGVPVERLQALVPIVFVFLPHSILRS